MKRQSLNQPTQFANTQNSSLNITQLPLKKEKKLCITFSKLVESRNAL